MISHIVSYIVLSVILNLKGDFKMMKSIGFKSMEVDSLDKLEHFNLKPNQIEFLTGRFGSGKTVALYNYINELSVPSILLLDYSLDYQNIIEQSKLKIFDFKEVDLCIKQPTDEISKFRKITTQLKTTLESLTNSKNELCIVIQNIKSLQELENNDLIYNELFDLLNNYINNLQDYNEDVFCGMDCYYTKIHPYVKNLNCYKTVIAKENKRHLIKLYSDERDNMVISCIDFKIINHLEELEKYSGKLSLRIPKSLHMDLGKKADSEGVSLNQYISYLLARNI